MASPPSFGFPPANILSTVNCTEQQREFLNSGGTLIGVVEFNGRLSPTPSLNDVPSLILDGSTDSDADSEEYTDAQIADILTRFQQSDLARNIIMSQRTEKICFVSVGATAKFDELIEAVLSDDFLDALGALDYTRIRIQYGESGIDFFAATIKKCQERHGGHVPHLIAVDGFQFAEDDFGQQMRAAKAENGRLEGMIVTAAGT
jgi:hypothetical protein